MCAPERGKISLPIPRQKARELYKNQIVKCGNGLVVVYDYGEGEKASNFYFSKELLGSSILWHNNAKNIVSVRTITDLFEEISPKVAKVASE